jgi:PhzF family phenazine biosynthesis protein
VADISLYQVDAFTNRPFAGNPAAVCPLSGPIPEALMQDIAAENNLSETAFFHAQGDAFSLRWFTPTTEVDLCGHATLASAFVLMTELEPARTEVTFRTKSGLLPVRRAPGDTFVLDFPAFPPAQVPDTALRERISALVGSETVDVLAARRTFVALLPDAAAVRRARPDLREVERLEHSLALTAAGGDETRPVDFVARYFAPTAGVPEDPVTGSLYCLLAPYWSRRLGKGALRARQVSRRGGEISCELAGERVHIAGQARLVIKGTLTY